VLAALGQGVFDFGEDPGAANVVKLAGNFMILSAVEAFAEALTFAQKSGVGRDAPVGMLTSTIFACPFYQNYGAMLAGEDYSKVGFKLRLALKDIALVLNTAATSQTPLPIASLLRDRLLSAMAHGRGEMDMTAMALGVGQDAGTGP